MIRVTRRLMIKGRESDGMPRITITAPSKEQRRLVEQVFAALENLELDAAGRVVPVRCKLPDERRGFEHKFSIEGHEGYFTVSYYEPETEKERVRGYGRPGELFIVMAKEGSTVSGLMDGFATSISLGLQYGVPLWAFAGKFKHMRFEPSGFTKNPDIQIAKSILDYIFRWLSLKFADESRAPQGDPDKSEKDSHACPECGKVVTMLTEGSEALRCPNCDHLIAAL